MDDKLATGLKRTGEMAAVFMIGNGLISLLQPRRHVQLWTSDVPWIDRWSKKERGRPTSARRLNGLIQLGAGLALASSLQPTREQRDRDGGA